MDMNREPDPELGSELRQTAGAEWIEEAAEDERLSDLQRRRGRGFADVVKDVANRGDRVSVRFGDHSFGGSITHAGTDYATVEGAGQAADVRYGAAVWSVIANPDRAEARPGGAETFAALLHEYAAAGTKLRFALPDKETLIGSVSVVAEDHIEVRDVDARTLYVPLEMVLGTIRSTEYQ